jgi:ATP-dependent HslUV protease ATP-binding subunit HslU
MVPHDAEKRKSACMSALTPRQIVAELDKYIVAQEQAKRMVAVAVRNRWRRRRLAPELRDEVAPKNIIMIGPTGVGKTEIARRLARLCAAPFIKVEATKYTEVGYVGRDVESMIRDLMEIGVSLVREEENARVRRTAEKAADDRLLDLLLPAAPGAESRESTREKLRKLWRLGHLDEREVEFDVQEQGIQGIDLFAMPGMEQVGQQMRDMFSKAMPQKTRRRKMKTREAWNILLQEESAKLVDQEALTDIARERVEQSGIVFIDEIDKVTSGSEQRTSDISREGVQRDLLPIVEGSSVNTKYGMVRTDHILFIAAGAFHASKPSDLLPELQGRFPLRTELQALGKEEFLRILTEPDNSLTRQYSALLATEDVRVEFTPDGLEEIAAFAEETNSNTENIGARRLYTVMEKILAEISFDAPEKPGTALRVDRAYVAEHIADLRQDKDLSRYVL